MTPQSGTQAGPHFVGLFISMSEPCLDAPSLSASSKVQGKDEGKFLECMI